MAAISAARTVLLSSIAMVIGPTPPGFGVIAPATWLHRLEIDVADEPVAVLRRGIIDAVHADIDDDRARLDHVGLDEMRLAHRGDEDVGAAAMLGDVFAARMEQRHGRVGVLVLLQEDRRHRLADDVAAAQHDDFRAAQSARRCG